MDDPVQELVASRWISGSYDKFIVQFKLLNHRNEALIYSCQKRDSSGLLKTQFLTVLLRQCSISCVQTPYRICSGAATVTVFIFIDLTDMTATKLMQIIARFINLNAVIFADCLDMMCCLRLIGKLA